MNNEVTENILGFILGGNCSFTLYQEQPVRQVSYKVVKSKDSDVYFLYIGKEGYKGYFFKNDLLNLRQGKKQINYSEEDKANIKAFMWLIRHHNNLPSIVHVLHHGKCSVCGRKLTDAKSLRCGIGPTCRERQGIKG